MNVQRKIRLRPLVPFQRTLLAGGFLLCSAVSAVSQASRLEPITVNPHLPPYWVRFVENAAAKQCVEEATCPTLTITPGGVGKNPPCKPPCPPTWLLGWLKIYRGEPARVFQTIEIKVDTTLVGQYAVKDVNFDGYKDIYFSVSRGAKFTQLEYWLFDPGSARFTKNQLAKQMGDIWPNDIQFDAQAKEIRTNHFYGGCDPLSRHTYRINNQRLFLISADDNIPGVDRDCVMVHVNTTTVSLDPAVHKAFEDWVDRQRQFPLTSEWTAEQISLTEFAYTPRRGVSTNQHVRILHKGAEWYAERVLRRQP